MRVDDRGRTALLRCLFVAGFVAAGFVGRATIIDGGALSLVWPAAGVAVVWFLVLKAGLLSVDTALLMAATGIVNQLTGASWPLVATFVIANVVQVQLVLVVMRRLAPTLRWVSGSAGLSESRSAVALFVGATVGSLGGALLGAVGFLLAGTPNDIESVLVWWGRNLVGTVTVVAVVHLVASAMAPGPRRATPSTRMPWWEQAALIATTLAAYGLLLPLEASHPAAFLVTLLTVWAAVRATTLWTVLHAVTCGTATVVATLAGTGPFASASSAPEKALLAQLFLATLLLTGLTLSTARHDRLRLLSEVDAERHEARREAALSAGVLASMEEGVVVVDDDDRIVLANAATTRIIGEGREQTSEFTLLDTDGQQLTQDDHPFSRARRDGAFGPTDVLMDRRDGSRMTLSVTARALGDDRSSPQGGAGSLGSVVGVYRDVTQDRASRHALASFAATVAHDLRGPLTSVRGWIDVANDEMAPDESVVDHESSLPAAALERALRGVDRMDGLIGDLLTHARAADVQLDVETIDLDDLVALVARDQGVAELVHITSLPQADGDPVLVRQVLENLLGNAVKYVAAGVTPSVTVTGSRRDEETQIEITDNGLGVPAGTDVFAPFVRAHPTHSPGTGLGLSICRAIIERHRGTLTVRPGPQGAGSTFTFTLPAPP